MKKKILYSIYQHLSEWMVEIPVRQRMKNALYETLYEERNEIAILYLKCK